MQSFKSKLFQNENNMRDVKDILDEAQESMDMAIMYLDEALAPRRKSRYPFAGRYPCGFLWKYGSYQQCGSRNHSGRTQHCHQAMG